ncbi:hypothetical protein J4457_05155 [Candidatus Woesearchaeota archaeon]|nr:hypothetical protein [Candidatus Woesearchaeota archaeon]
MIFLFSFTFSIPFAIILDYIMEITQGWYIPSSFFDPYRILGYVSIEQLIWLFLYLYLVAIFYEAFLEKTCTHRLYSSHLKYGIILLYLIFGLFIIIHLTKHELLEINYFYLKFGIVLGLLPIAVALIKFPRLYTQFLQTAAYFFYLSFLYEVTALVLGQWTFPATNQFVGFLSLGSISFPFEELFFWIILGAMGALSYYKLLGEKG